MNRRHALALMASAAVPLPAERKPRVIWLRFNEGFKVEDRNWLVDLDLSDPAQAALVGLPAITSAEPSLWSIG